MSQSAIEYCCGFLERNLSIDIVWVHVASLPQFTTGYRNIVRRRSLPAWDELDLITSQTVCDWLSNPDHGSWPIVLDSSGDLELLFKKSSKPVNDGADIHLSHFIPRNSIETMIVRTRDRGVAERIADRQSPITMFTRHSIGGEELLRSKVTRRVRGLKSRCA